MSNSRKTIKPSVLGGFRDLMPAESYALQRMFDRIRAVYESFGFMPLDTPSIENKEVLTGGAENFEKSIFVARIVRGAEDKGVTDDTWEQDYALRFDLTVPLARVVAANPELPRPFKRYQLGKVWRGEKPQAGRFREFWQFDFDIIGSESINADIEVIQVMYQTLLALQVPRFVIKFNTRKVLNGLAETVGCDDKATEFFRLLDKVDKLGVDGVISAMQRQPDNAYDESALALTDEQANVVRRFLGLSGTTTDLLIGLSALIGQSTVGIKGIEELNAISSTLIQIGIPQEYWLVDLSVARGLDYYTGPVFETTLRDLPEIGSVFSGGRFDGLTDRFMADSNIAGVGASVGVDRLFVAMQRLGLIELSDAITDVLVATHGSDESIRVAAAKLAQTLRDRGYKTECYLGGDTTMRAQLAYAVKRSIPWVAIIGSEEVAQNKVALKNLASREQTLLTREEVFAKLDQQK